MRMYIYFIPQTAASFRFTKDIGNSSGQLPAKLLQIFEGIFLSLLAQRNSMYQSKQRT